MVDGRYKCIHGVYKPTNVTRRRPHLVGKAVHGPLGVPLVTNLHQPEWRRWRPCWSCAPKPNPSGPILMNFEAITPLVYSCSPLAMSKVLESYYYNVYWGVNRHVRPLLSLVLAFQPYAVVKCRCSIMSNSLEVISTLLKMESIQILIV